MIRLVETGSPAQKAGIKTGDVLKTIDGQATVDTDTYRYAAREVSANQSLRLEVWRDGRLIALTLKAGTYPPERAFMLAEELLGITVEDLTAPNRRRFHLEFLSGVVVTEVHPDSYLARVGVGTGRCGAPRSAIRRWKILRPFKKPWSNSACRTPWCS